MDEERLRKDRGLNDEWIRNEWWMNHEWIVNIVFSPNRWPYRTENCLFFLGWIDSRSLVTMWTEFTEEIRLRTSGSGEGDGYGDTHSPPPALGGKKRGMPGNYYLSFHGYPSPETVSLQFNFIPPPIAIPDLASTKCPPFFSRPLLGNLNVWLLNKAHWEGGLR